MSGFGLLEHINQLASNSSRNFKINYLVTHLDKNLYNLFAYTLDPMRRFGLRTLPPITPAERTTATVDELWTLLDRMTQISHSNETIALYSEFASRLDADDKTVLDKILSGDLQCGVLASTLNTAIAKSVAPFEPIVSYPCMLCSAFSQKAIDALFASSPQVLCQEKCDGMRFNAIADRTTMTVVYRGRSGRRIYVNSPDLDRVFLDMVRGSNSIEPLVFDGELLVMDSEGRIGDRKTGNGILNSAIHATITEEALARVHATIWDVIPLSAFNNRWLDTPYLDRYWQLRNMFNFINYDQRRVSLVDTTLISSATEAEKIFQRMIAEGKEGVILKDPHSPWGDRRSTQMVKIKGEEECELRVTQVFIGTTGKVLGKLAKVRARTDDGKLEVDVGSGFSDEEREQFIRMPDLIGKIITVRYNAKIKSKGDKVASLFLPRFIEIREDKDTTNLESEI